MTDCITVCICEKREKYPHEFKQCSQCKKVRYCSVECQAKHWPVHKANCNKLIGEGGSIYKFLDKIDKNENKTNKTYILDTAMEMCADKKEQQIILAEIQEKRDNIKFFYLDNDEVRRNPLDEEVKRHLDICKTNHLIFIHDLKTMAMITMEIVKM